ncbi:MAG: hypothetical protein WC150_07250 [Bacteroidia bacterium]
MPSKKLDWLNTDERFVAFFDILGFKDLVNRNSHADVLKKLKALKDKLSDLQKKTELPLLKADEINQNQTRSVTFSDSIILFSNGASILDAKKIIYDSYFILRTAIINKIAIKGAISFGEITVDFDNNLFFGQPIIDSYLLHEELEMINVVIDNYAEVRISNLKGNEEINKVLIDYKVPMKFGKAKHKLLRPSNSSIIKMRIIQMEKMYSTTSGKPRRYIDNTLEFLHSL